MKQQQLKYQIIITSDAHVISIKTFSADNARTVFKQMINREKVFNQIIAPSAYIDLKEIYIRRWGKTIFDRKKHWEQLPGVKGVTVLKETAPDIWKKI